MLSAGSSPFAGLKANSHWLRPNSTSGQPQRHDVAPDDLKHRLHLVVALFGQVLIAVREKTDRWWLARLARILRRHFGGFELEDVALDFKSGQEIVAARFELREHLLIEMAGRERDRPPVGEIDIAQQPAGRRRPWQHAKAQGIRYHQNVCGAFHLLHAETAACREHRKDGLVRGILGEHRGGDGAATLQRRQRLARDQRLASENSVLIRKREPDHLKLVILDDAPQPRRRFLPLARPQTMTLNKAQRVTPSRY